MVRSLFYYLQHFLRREWIHTFLFARTAPLVTPQYFRDHPVRTGKECTHCFSCRMVCPAPGAIEVVQNAGVWGPVIFRGHCIRCGLCVEICPENVLASGRVREDFCRDTSGWRTTYRIRVDPNLCMKCGNCVVSCPVNKELDPEIAAGGHSSNDEVIMRIENGQHQLIHEERTTGCRTCEEACPNGAMRVIRILEAVQGVEECISD